MAQIRSFCLIQGSCSHQGPKPWLLGKNTNKWTGKLSSILLCENASQSCKIQSIAKNHGWYLYGYVSGGCKRSGRIVKLVDDELTWDSLAKSMHAKICYYCSMEFPTRNSKALHFLVASHTLNPFCHLFQDVSRHPFLWAIFQVPNGRGPTPPPHESPIPAARGGLFCNFPTQRHYGDPPWLTGSPQTKKTWVFNGNFSCLVSSGRVAPTKS